MDASAIISSLITAISLVIGYVLTYKATIKKQNDEMLNKQIDSTNTIMEQLRGLSEKLNKHIKQDEQAHLQEIRFKILDYANSILNGRNHTEEEYKYIIGLCDQYEVYCTTNNVLNGVATEAINEIRESYAKKRTETSFLRKEF